MGRRLELDVLSFDDILGGLSLLFSHCVAFHMYERAVLSACRTIDQRFKLALDRDRGLDGSIMLDLRRRALQDLIDVLNGRLDQSLPLDHPHKLVPRLPEIGGDLV